MEIDWQRLSALRDHRAAADLSQAEVLELYRLENKVAPNAYAQVVAALSAFPPYLAPQPALIGPFIEGLYTAWRTAFRGNKTRQEFTSFLNSKAHVDDDLGAALTAHPAEFAAALDRLFQ